MRRKKTNIIGLVISVAICVTFFSYWSVSGVNAQDYDLSMKIFDTALQTKQQIDFNLADFPGMTDMVIADMGGDGVNEIIVSYGYADIPVVKVLRQDASLIDEFQPYPVGYKGRINLAVADFDNDGKKEIVTSPGEGGGPHIRIFDGSGSPKFGDKGFFATDATYRNGVEIATGDVNGNGSIEIVTSMVFDDKFIVKIFDKYGKQLYNEIEIKAEQYFEPLKITAFNLNDDKPAEIITASSVGNKPIIRVFDYLGEQVSEFWAYAEGFKGGFEVDGFNVDNKKLIVTSAGYSGGPHLRFYDLLGNVNIDPRFFAYDTGFRGGVNVETYEKNGQYYIASLPQTSTSDGSLTSFGKVIKVDISEQKLYAYEKGRLIDSFLISSGKYGFDTPFGKFTVYRKSASARMSWNYGPNNPNNYDLPNVPDILAFYGPFTIHGAYWHSNWGHRMSHGCVNVDLKHADWLYHWAPIGTPVIIEQ